MILLLIMIYSRIIHISNTNTTVALGDHDTRYSRRPLYRITPCTNIRWMSACTSLYRNVRTQPCPDVDRVGRAHRWRARAT